ncbi:MAG: pyrroline-5-carboxylate reductase [Oscillospiraceae bacterium]|nr:pyrroline-5-carboxylate reductase [Oscillospiraceae bacterium]
MNKNIAFIGAGVMAGAILRGACQSVEPGQFWIADKMQEKAETLATELGCMAAASNLEAARAADYIFLCIKPQMAAEVLQEIAPALRESLDAGQPKVLCSILAGVTIDTIRVCLDSPRQPVVRIMPNTPALVGAGFLLITADETVPEAHSQAILNLLAPCGALQWLDERLFDTATALTGSSPAFYYMFIDAMADAGVQAGLPRQQAIAFAAQAALGSAAMVLETGQHPGVLKDMVCSPGGSTIAGVSALEAGGFRQAVMSAVAATCARNKELGEMV